MSTHQYKIMSAFWSPCVITAFFQIGYVGSILAQYTSCTATINCSSIFLLPLEVMTQWGVTLLRII